MAFRLGGLLRGTGLLTGAVLVDTIYSKKKLASCLDTPFESKYQDTRFQDELGGAESRTVHVVEKPNATSRHLILIPHGQCHKQGKTRKLTDLGHQQAVITGKTLKRLQERIILRRSRAERKVGITPKKFKCVITHYTMTSAEQTSQDIIKAFKTESIQAQPLPIGDVLKGLLSDPYCTIQVLIKRWLPAYPLSHIGYNIEELLDKEPEIRSCDFELLCYPQAKFEHAFKKWADADQKKETIDVVICHADVIKLIMRRVCPLDWWKIKHLPLAHCSITYIEIKPNGKRSLQGEFGGTKHLQKDMITYD